MAGDTCDVCGSKEVVGVFASVTGPISFAFCKTCLSVEAEPANAIDTVFVCCNGNLAGWLLNHYTYENGKYVRVEDYINHNRQRLDIAMSEFNSMCEQHVAMIALDEVDPTGGDDFDDFSLAVSHKDD